MTIFGTNGVAMARNGPILWENDATGSTKVFRYLSDLWEAIKNSKVEEKVQKQKNDVNYRIFNIALLAPISPVWAPHSYQHMLGPMVIGRCRDSPSGANYSSSQLIRR